MKLKNIELFESLLSPKKQRLHWYRGIAYPDLEEFIDDYKAELYDDDPDRYEDDVDLELEYALREWLNNLDQKDIGVFNSTAYGDGTPALWFTTNIDVLTDFLSDSQTSILIEVKFDKDLNLFNYFDSNDFNILKLYLIKNGEKMPVEALIKYNNEFDVDAYVELEEYARLIKALGFDGIIMKENTTISVEIFYNMFDIIKVYTEKQLVLLAYRFNTGKETKYFNKRRKHDIEKKQILLGLKQ